MLRLWIIKVVLLLLNIFFRHSNGFMGQVHPKWGNMGQQQHHHQQDRTGTSTGTTFLQVANTKVGSSTSTTNTDSTSSFLLNDFKTASGELINPYKVLKISRKATREQVRKSYIELSRRYHPDGVRNRDLLPGNCNNLNDVRDQWERIKLSYEILSNKKLRMKYDREEALADPGAAIQRAAVTAAMDSFVSIGKGIFDAGAFAVTKLVEKK
jgi:DnaJ domain